MRTTRNLLLLILAFSAGLGVNYTRVVQVHHYDGVAWVSPLAADDEFVVASLEYWKVEVARRFPTALIYAIHGGDIDGQWMCQTEDLIGIRPVKELALELQAKNPDRIIVLVCCNPGGYDLGVPGVYHARANVWFVPDKDADNTDPSRQESRECVGNIYEFDDR